MGSLSVVPDVLSFRRICSTKLRRKASLWFFLFALKPGHYPSGGRRLTAGGVGGAGGEGTCVPSIPREKNTDREGGRIE